MKKTGGRLVFLFIVVAIIIVVLCVIPYPKTIKMTMQGMEFSNTGEILCTETAILTVTKYHYLLKEDAYHFVSIDLNGNIYDCSSLTNRVLPHTSSTTYCPFDRISFDSFYNPTNDWVRVSFCLAENQHWAAFQLCFDNETSKYYILSSQENFDYSVIWNSYATVMFSLS